MLIVVTHSADLARTLPRQMEMNDGTLIPLARLAFGAASATVADAALRVDED